VDRKLINFGAMIVVSVILYFMSKAMMGETRTPCAVSLKNAYQALSMYAVENDERFPDAAHWMDRVAFQQGTMLSGCDAVKEGIGFAFSDRYSAAVIPQPSEEEHLLIYDSTKLGANEHDRLESLPNPGRHGGKNHGVTAAGNLELDLRP
jgi:hypothetical protein